jgi:HD-GYP domain-containing protein (c-di-GMP phosphodiesterase class II)
MPINQIKVRIPDLLEGMYVARLDRPWLDTPYKIQGFHIKTRQDIDKLQQYAEFVYIDVEKSKLDNGADSKQNGGLSDAEVKQKLTGARPRTYSDISDFESEMNTALENHTALTECVDDVMRDISNNEKLKMPMLRKAVTPMVESIVRNAEAFSWLTMMKTRDNYTYTHSVSSSIWAVAFGRSLGLPKKDLLSLAVGALLFDVGKVRKSCCRIRTDTIRPSTSWCKSMSTTASKSSARSKV